MCNKIATVMYNAIVIVIDETYSDHSVLVHEEACDPGQFVQ